MGSTLLPFRYRFLEGVMGKFRRGRQGRLDLNKFPSDSKTLRCCHLHELRDCSEHQFCGLTANNLPAFVSAFFPYSGSVSSLYCLLPQRWKGLDWRGSLVFWGKQKQFLFFAVIWTADCWVGKCGQEEAGYCGVMSTLLLSLNLILRTNRSLWAVCRLVMWF